MIKCASPVEELKSSKFERGNMELADDDFDAYELDATGMIIKSPANGDDAQTAAAAARGKFVHRSGSIDITAAAGYGGGLGSANSNSREAHAAAASGAAGTSAAASYNAKLADKIRAQAVELQQLKGKLEDSYDYSRLCERRICELHPHHPIPITEDCLGVANVAGSAAGSKVEARGGGTGRSAKLRRENAELAESNKALKQLKSARNKLTDVSRNLKETRRQSERKDKELAYREKRIKQLQAQLQKLAHPNRPQRPRGVPSAREKPDISFEPTASRQGSAVEDAALLRKEVASLRHSLQSEARASEEQRVYINVLEAAVQSKAGEMGLKTGQASLLTKLARLEANCNQNGANRKPRSLQVKAMEAEMEDLRTRENKMASASAAQQDQIRSLSDRLAQFGRGEDELLSSVQTLESEKTALLDYVQENVARTAELTPRFRLSSQTKYAWKRSAVTLSLHSGNNLALQSKSCELHKIKTSEGDATIASLKEDASKLRSELQRATCTGACGREQQIFDCRRG